MNPIPLFIIDKIFPNLMHNGGLFPGTWNELLYSCNETLLLAVSELEEEVRQLDYSDLPALKGTERQVAVGMDIREKALRAEVALQKVLIGSKIVRFSLAPGIKELTDSRFWIENKSELTRRFKIPYTRGSKREMDIYKIPDSLQWLEGRFSIWQSRRLSYTWEINNPALEALRRDVSEEALQESDVVTMPVIGGA